MRRYGWPPPQYINPSGIISPARLVLYDENGHQLAEQIFSPINLSPGDSLELKWQVQHTDNGLTLLP